MKNRTFSWLLVLLSTAAVSACSSDDSSGSGPTSCSGTTPIECRSNDGALQGCCPTTHSECSADGLSCAAPGTGGGSGSGGTGATGGASGGTAGTSGAGGATGGSAGTGGGSGGATGGASGTGGATGGTSGTGGATGGTSGTGGATGGTGGGSGGTGGASCVDVGFEPNETSATATPLPAIGDCDGPKKVVFAKLDGSSDADWYKYTGTDGGCIVDPSVTLDVNARLCMYFTCPGVTVNCKGTSTMSFVGPGPGCCAATGGTLKATPSCTGAETTTTYIRVDNSSKNECVNYSIDYHY